MRWTLLCCFLLLITACHASPHNKKQQRKHDREFKATRNECLQNVCNDLHPEENDNCLNKCTSNTCFNKMYASAELEPGEVDHIRWHRFQKCARLEIKKRTKEQWQAAREAARIKNGGR